MYVFVYFHEFNFFSMSISSCQFGGGDSVMLTSQGESTGYNTMHAFFVKRKKI